MRVLAGNFEEIVQFQQMFFHIMDECTQLVWNFLCVFPCLAQLRKHGISVAVLIDCFVLI